MRDLYPKGNRVWLYSKYINERMVYQWRKRYFLFYWAQVFLRLLWAHHSSACLLYTSNPRFIFCYSTTDLLYKSCFIIKNSRLKKYIIKSIYYLSKNVSAKVLKNTFLFNILILNLNISNLCKKVLMQFELGNCRSSRFQKDRRNRR